MIVYVESNFILELAFQREDQENCSNLLGLAESQAIDMAIPAFSIGEPYEAWVRRYKQRKELYNRLSLELQELSRSKPYQEVSKNFHEITALLVKSGEEEKQRLDDVLNRILDIARVIPIESKTIKASIIYQTSLNLSPQDAIVFASVINHLLETQNQSNCFITRNSKDFINPNIISELANYDCKLLTTFRGGLGYIASHP